MQLTTEQRRELETLMTPQELKLNQPAIADYERGHYGAEFDRLIQRLGLCERQRRARQAKRDQERIGRQPKQEDWRAEQAAKHAEWDRQRWEREEKARKEPPPPKQKPGEMTYSEALRALGLAAGSSNDEIRRAYRKLAKRHHPDRGGSAETMRELNRAYALLTKGNR